MTSIKLIYKQRSIKCLLRCNMRINIVGCSKTICCCFSASNTLSKEAKTHAITFHIIHSPPFLPSCQRNRGQCVVTDSSASPRTLQLTQE